MPGTVKYIGRNTSHRICSGQAIATLATAVKELIENSLDSGATSIEIRLKEYGSSLIEVADNGPGIRCEDYEAVTLKYHTSKLAAFSDLEGLSTLGFRGEALSSLCCVASVSIVTRCGDQHVGSRLEYDHEGKLVRESPVARAPGTTVVVKDIFHTLPVRYKELQRNLRREYSKLVSIIQAYAAVSTNTRMLCTNSYGKSGRSTVVCTRQPATLKENLIAVFGPKLAEGLQSLEVDIDDGSKISGFVSRGVNNASKIAGGYQYFYVNGRPVDLPKFVKVLNETYRSLSVGSKPSLRPMAVLNLLIPQAMVDVNVTPDKRKVFLQNEDLICDKLHSALRELWECSLHTFHPVDVSTPSAQSRLTPPATPALKPAQRLSGFKQKTTQVELDVKSGVCGVKRKMESSFGQGKTADVRKTKQALVHQFFATESTGQICGADCLEVAIPPPNFTAESNSDMALEQRAEPENRAIRDVQMDQGQHENSSGSSMAVEDGAAEVLISSACNDVRTCKGNDVDLELRQHCGADGTGEVCTLTPGAGISPKESSLSKNLQEDKRQQNRDEYVQLDATNGVSHENPAVSQRVEFGEATANADLQISAKCESLARSETQDAITCLNQDTPQCRMSPLSQSRCITGQLKTSTGTDTFETSRSIMGTDAVNGPIYAQVQPTYCDQVYTGKAISNVVPDDSGNGFAVECNLSHIRHQWKQSYDQAGSLSSGQEPAAYFNAASLQGCQPSISAKEREAAAADELARVFKKEDFAEMHVIGQFNKGFVLARLHNEVFIVDQHASDEKYNFERLVQNAVLCQQNLLKPVPVNLSAAEEVLIRSNTHVFAQNGFQFVDSPDGETLLLKAVPVGRNILFGPDDVADLVMKLDATGCPATISSGVPESNDQFKRGVPRPSRVRAMLAMQACRSSIMIGKALSHQQMEQIVRNLGTLEVPWNCPHGRPTLRHLCSLPSRQ